MFFCARRLGNRKMQGRKVGRIKFLGYFPVVCKPASPPPKQARVQDSIRRRAGAIPKIIQ